MSQPTINCPKCNTEVKLTESLAAPLLQSLRYEYEEKLTQKDKEIFTREQLIKNKEQQLKYEQDTLQEKLQLELEKEREIIAKKEHEKAKKILNIDLDAKTEEIKNLQEINQSNEEKLAEAQKAHVDILKQKRSLEDEKRALDLTIEKSVHEKLNEVRLKALKDAEESSNLKFREQEIKNTQMKKQIDELKRQLEQGSQQLQGEAQELDLEEMLRTKFAIDSIEAVPKGNYGGDILHRIINNTGQMVGTILWESKRTKNWSDSWLSKLKEDQREAKAGFSILISQTLPADVEMFSLKEGVYITHPRTAFPVALALRQHLLELFAARKSGDGQQTKMEIVYQYLTGPNFRHRVEAIVDAFSSMKEDLEQEKRAIQKHWAKRDKQIENIMIATSGMYGDLQAIAGKTLIEIKSLEIENSELQKIEYS